MLLYELCISMSLCIYILFNVRTMCWTIYSVVILMTMCSYVCHYLIYCVSMFFIYDFNSTYSNYVYCAQTTNNNIYDFYLFYQIFLSPRSSKTDKIGFAQNRSSKPVGLSVFLSDLSIQFKKLPI
jgi:hypothetical protein